jgi:hypothetical protein
MSWATELFGEKLLVKDGDKVRPPRPRQLGTTGCTNCCCTRPRA